MTLIEDRTLPESSLPGDAPRGIVNIEPPSLGKHIAALDGLRGIAILMVLMAHFNDEGLLKQYYPIAGPVVTKLALSGLKGVELFFVLSGFLITGILLNSRQNHHYFRNFYARRFLRIFPLYYGTLAILFLILPHVLTLDAGASGILHNQWKCWTYLFNVPAWKSPGWDSSSLFLVGHFWSLAVEEHFYIIWPALVWFCNDKRLAKVCICMIAMAFLARGVVALQGDEAFWLFRWTSINKMDGLALGSLLAILLRSPQWWNRLKPWVGKAGIVLFFAFMAGEFLPRAFLPKTMEWLMGTISIVFFAALLLLSVNVSPGNAFHGATCDSLRMFGKYSYGIYVIHGILRPSLAWAFPKEMLISVCRIPALGMACYTLLAVGISLGLAMLSWHLYEKQFLKLKRFFEYQ